ncbi:MAG: Ni/Fe hydrogenase subunit alpha [Pseudomonadota bacterium]
MTDSSKNKKNLKRTVIEPLTRVEGHGKVVLLQDENNRIKQVRFHVVEFRGFEKFIQGRPYWELPVLVQRLCGICPVSHHLAAAKATDMLVGAQKITPTAEKIRRLMHFGQTLQSHALHLFHLSAPDLLFGFDDEVNHRNIIGVINDHPEIARQGVLLRKFGQEVIRHTAGKRVHGTGAVPGGVNKSLTIAERDELLGQCDQVIEWGIGAVALVKRIYLDKSDYHGEFATISSNMLSLSGQNGELEIYDGTLRAKDAAGGTIFDGVDPCDYSNYLGEEVRSWSYMKFPFIRDLGTEAGWYRVGPLARVNNCDRITTALAEKERLEFKAIAGESLIVQSTLAYHWARMIELLYCAESIKELLLDDDIHGSELINKGERQRLGFGVIEAPRGTLFHHYEVDDDGLVERANLIVSTTQNNQAINESIRQVANHYLDGQELTEPLLNQIEVAIRAYDPCLSCATHALGKMPLQIELVDAHGSVVDRIEKRTSGDINHHC